MNFFENKIAILISLLMQLKAYAPQKVNDMLEIEKLEGILDKPEISDRDWEKECPEDQVSFLNFLNTNISVCERVLELLKEKDSLTSNPFC